MNENEQKNSYNAQLKVSFWSLLLELGNFVAVTVSAVVSGSLIVWMDFVDSFGNVLNAGIVALLSKKLKRDLKYEYNYGVGKIEAISSLACDGILICGLLVMLASSVKDLFSPLEPSGLLIYVVFLKVVNVAFDAIFLRAQYKIKKTNKTAIVVTEFNTSLKCFAFDAVALLSILICWLFREVHAVWYFSPVICIILAILFFIGAVRRSVESVRVLTDRTLPEEEQLKILSVLARFNGKYKSFEFLSTRKSGNTVFVDLKLSFDDATTYAELKTLCGEIRHEIEKVIENSKVSFVISDGTH